MANPRYEINKGETEFQITQTVGLATVNKNLEVTYDNSVWTEKDQIIRALEMIINRILKDNYPVI